MTKTNMKTYNRFELVYSQGKLIRISDKPVRTDRLREDQAALLNDRKEICMAEFELVPEKKEKPKKKAVEPDKEDIPETKENKKTK